MREPHVSVIIPHLPSRLSLPDLSRQIYRDFEVIVVIDSERKGQGWACNQGVDRANGDLLLFLDDDTHPKGELIEKLARAINSEWGYDIAFCNTMVIPLDGSNTGYVREATYQVKAPGVMLVRRSSFTKFDETLPHCSDYDFCLRMRHNGLSGVCVPEVLLEMITGQEEALSRQNDTGYWRRVVEARYAK